MAVLLVTSVVWLVAPPACLCRRLCTAACPAPRSAALRRARLTCVRLPSVSNTRMADLYALLAAAAAAMSPGVSLPAGVAASCASMEPMSTLLACSAAQRSAVIGATREVRGGEGEWAGTAGGTRSPEQLQVLSSCMRDNTRCGTPVALAH